MTTMAGLGRLWNSIQTWLFPMLEDELGELDDKHKEFVAVCETCTPQAHMDTYRWWATAARLMPLGRRTASSPIMRTNRMPAMTAAIGGLCWIGWS